MTTDQAVQGAGELDATASLSRAKDVVGDIAEESREIVNGYLELARHDLRQELADAHAALVATLVGALAVAVAAMLLAGGVCLGLARYLGTAPWVTLTGAGAVGVGIGAIVLAHDRWQAVEDPEAINEAKEDLAWIAEHV